MTNIEFYSQDIDMPEFFDKEFVNELLKRMAMYYSKKLGEISFIFCSDKKIREVNNKYLNHDYYTDTITFDYCKGNQLNGDIFIGLETILSNSEKYGTQYYEEFHRVICHSVLHLIGFKDKTDEARVIMQKNEEICLELLKKLRNE